jgi:hypothetical protein
MCIFSTHSLFYYIIAEVKGATLVADLIQLLKIEILLRNKPGNEVHYIKTCEHDRPIAATTLRVKTDPG